MNFAVGIRRARVRNGVSQRKLAGLAGFDSSYVNLLETGKRKPSMESLEALADALKMPMSLLLLSCAEKRDLRGLGSGEAEELFSKLLDIIRNEQG